MSSEENIENIKNYVSRLKRMTLQNIKYFLKIYNNKKIKTFYENIHSNEFNIIDFPIQINNLIDCLNELPQHKNKQELLEFLTQVKENNNKLVELYRKYGIYYNELAIYKLKKNNRGRKGYGKKPSLNNRDSPLIRKAQLLTKWINENDLMPESTVSPKSVADINELNNNESFEQRKAPLIDNWMINNNNNESSERRSSRLYSQTTNTRNLRQIRGGKKRRKTRRRSK